SNVLSQSLPPPLPQKGEGKLSLFRLVMLSIALGRAFKPLAFFCNKKSRLTAACKGNACLFYPVSFKKVVEHRHGKSPPFTAGFKIFTAHLL
ncbi:MAG: hypothetical protein Q4G07_11395, partial [Oscillospiraceae bacterium]|nr:hypothetical protein [Oscillospiraceae bacterium]